MYRKSAKPIQLVVKEPEELMTFLMKQLAGISRNKVKSYLTNRRVWVDGTPITRYNFQLATGQQVLIHRDLKRPERNIKGLDIVYEDEYLIVIDKHAGILSMGKAGPTNAQTILNGYLERSGQHCTAHTVHRLDRETSGLMLYAKDVEMKEFLANNWKDLVNDRRYIAVVEGEMEKESGTVSSFLLDDDRYHTHSSPVDNGGKWAITHYRTLNRENGRSLVELRLETGRKNQIRVHMEDLGHSVVGDIKYGASAHMGERLALHAIRLSFRHPVTHEPLDFETPIPPELWKMMEGAPIAAEPAPMPSRQAATEKKPKKSVAARKRRK